MNATTTPDLITTREACDLLSVDPTTLWRARKRGDLRAVRIGRAIRYDKAEIRRFVAERTERPLADFSTARAA